jgi:DNA-directed RNA polymerase subunit M/transcription elongation factor TFIIS
MEEKFCKKCERFMTFVIKNNIIYKYCEVCNEYVEYKKKIIQEKQKFNKKKRFYYAMIHDNITYPSTNKKIANHSCGNDILIYAKNYETMKNFYVCQNCGKSWE